MAGDSREPANQAQIEYWNGAVGQRWAEHHRALDAVFAPFTQALFETADLGPGARVLDIGCGAGDIALRAAQAVGPAGRVTAVDLSEPLLAAGRGRAGAEPPGGAPVAWLRADAQVHAFEPRFDHALSRFGVMFFDDSVAAFANIRRALVPDGRLSFLSWRSMEENAWVALAHAAVLRVLTDVEPVRSDAPGPFRFAEREVLLPILEAAGFRGVACDAVDRPMMLGDTPTAAAAFVTTRGPCARLLKDCTPELREAALRAVAEAFVERAADRAGPVSLGAACWLVRARG